MLRVFVLIILALLVLPGATAAGTAPIASVKIAPNSGGQHGEGEPYYLWANVTKAEAPRAAQPTDDCWRDPERPPPGPEGAAQGIVQPIANWDPLAQPRLSGWFPRCISTEVRHEGATEETTTARASYDVTTGRYYLGTTAPSGATLPIAGGLPIAPPGAVRFQTASSVQTTGTTGVSMVTDCEECPPPI